MLLFMNPGAALSPSMLYSRGFDVEELGHDSGPQVWREVIVADQHSTIGSEDSSWYLTKIQYAPLQLC